MLQNHPHNITILNVQSVILFLVLSYCASQNVTRLNSYTRSTTDFGGRHISSTQPTNNTSLGSSKKWELMYIFILLTSCSCVLISIVGLTGNLLVICVLTGSSNRLVYETFCVGLACTDFTYLILTSPITVLQYYLKTWIFGLFWCKVFNFIIQVTVFSTAFMLLGLTTSRFLSVVLPWHNLKMTELQARLSCLAAWSVGILFALPILMVYTLVSAPETKHPVLGMNDTTSTVDSSRQFCREQFSSQANRMGYQLFVFLSTYVLPFVAIIIMNSMIVYKLQQKNIMERHNWVQRTEGSFVSSKVKSTAPQRLNRDSLPLRAFRTFRTHGRGNNAPASGHCPCDETSCEVNHEDSLEIEASAAAALSPAELVRLRKEAKQRKRRSKATKLVVLVTTLWCFCWLPTHIIMSWYFFDEASFPFTPTMKVIKLLSQTLSFAASCVNPMVYGIMTGTFRTAISKRLCRRHREALNGGTASDIVSP